MRHLHKLPPVDMSKLEVGGKGQNAVKVWFEKPTVLVLWFSFDEASEEVAYERAFQAMSDNPGAKWAVKEPCCGACAGLPVVLGHRVWLEGPLTENAMVSLLRLTATKNGSLWHGNLLLDVQELAVFRYAIEVEPGMWRATQWGRDYVRRREEVA